MGEIETVIRSEVMDEKTCDACKAVDEMEFKVDSPEAKDFLAGPYRHCKYGDKCRGINIYVIKDGGGKGQFE